MMRRLLFVRLAVAIFWLAGVALGAEADALQALIAKLPADDPAIAHDVFQGIMKGAPASVVELTRRLVEPGKGDDVKVRFALHGLAIYTSRPGAEAERKGYTQALCGQLESELPSAVKGFLLMQLQLAGGPENAPAIARFLLDKDLCEYATQALLVRKDKAVIPLFAEALPKATGGCRLTILQALGVLQAAKSLPPVLKAVGDGDREVRLTAAAALANSGDPAAVDALLKAAEAESPYERSQMTDAALLLARRLGEAGGKAGAERICRQLLKTRTGEGDVHVRCAAVQALAAAVGADAMPDVLAAMSSDNLAYRAAGIAAAVAMPGEKATQRWVEQLKTATPTGKVAILDLLAQRGDAAALPAVLDAMKDPEEAVRIAAIRSAARTGNEGAVPSLAALLASGKPGERAAARLALVQIPGRPVTDAIVKTVASAEPEAAAALLDALAARTEKPPVDAVMPYATHKEGKVRAAAIAAAGTAIETAQIPVLVSIIVGAKEDGDRAAAEKALIGACARLADKDTCVAALAPALDLAKDNAAVRAALLRILGTLGNPKAYEAVRAGLADKDDTVRDAVIRALSDWRDDTPTAELLQIARTAPKETHQVLALRGYVRMIAVRKDRPAAERLAMCQQAMDVAKRDDERKLVLSAIGEVPSLDALKMAEGLLGTAALKNEAAGALMRIAKVVSSQDRDAAKQAIAKATAATDNPEVQKQAKEALADIERFEDFVITWLVAGPYKGGKTSQEQPPERPDAKDVKWKLVAAAGDPPGFVNLNQSLGGGENVSGYLKAQVWSPKDQPAQIESGSDDGIKIWLNGKAVCDKDVPRGFKMGDDQTQVTLKQGWNDLLVKVVQGSGDWSVAVRIRAADGGRLPGLKLKAE